MFIKMIVIYPVALLLTLLLSMKLVFAENIAENSKHDSRIRQVQYREQDVITLSVPIYITMQVELGENENILAVESGDASTWSLHVPDKFSNRFFIKPTQEGSLTNLTVLTQQHTYYFSLQSKEKNSAAVYGLKINLPKDNRLLKLPLSQAEFIPKSIKNIHYRYHGARYLLPETVFDDGKFTYFKMHSNQRVPAVFAVDNSNGNESIVNVQKQGDVIIAKRIAPQWTLRDGDKVLSLFNENNIMEINGYDKKNRRQR